MPSSSTSGWSSETMRLKIGRSQIDRPTPCPYCSAEGGLLVGEAELLGRRPDRARCRPWSTPGLTSAIAVSM